jgi:uncharacterized cupin superfamily protein
VVEEAPLRMTKFGLVADTRGWFVVNAREARWRDAGRFGAFCDFEGKKPFLQLGFNVSVFRPGEAMGRYHRETAQEDFLVVSGSCVLIVEGHERELRAWDFVHCPPGTEHIIVAGDEGAVVVAVGARGRGKGGVVYVVSEAAARYGASVERETTKSKEAYAGLPAWRRVPYEHGWLPDLGG